ncbi:spore germination protein GerW family protein [Halobacteriales archaeon Cl-PHB]
MSLEEDEETAAGESSGEPTAAGAAGDEAAATEGRDVAEEMDLPEDFSDLLGSLQDSANARAVFGDPVERGGRTVIPVARYGFGFGGGSGTEPGEEDDEAAGSGVGMGGGLMARPVGALEITDHDTRFVGVGGGRRRTATAAVLAFLAGWLLARTFGGSGDEDSE